MTGRALELAPARHALRESSARAASVDTSNTVFNEIVRRCVSDLYMLITDTPHGHYPYAGTPWFSTPFGRDGLITALQCLWLDPNIALGVHLYHGAWSLFQSMGWNSPRFNKWRRWFSIGFATLITVGNVSFPVAVLAGIVA